MSKFTKTIAGFAGSIALIASLAGSVSAASFSTNLTVGSKGDDVSALQAWLVSKGFLVMPAGVSYGYFGGLTKAAVASYQKAKGISPSVGYFGPITRAAVNADGGAVVGGGSVALCPNGMTLASNCTQAPSGTSTPTAGTCSASVEGSFSTRLASLPSDNANIRTTSDVPVYGIEVKAVKSDISVDRVDLQVAVTVGGNAQNPGSFITGLTFKDGSTVLKTVALTTADFSKDSNDRYHVLVSGIGFKVPANATKVLTVTMNTATISSTDSNRTVTVQGYAGNSNNIRGVDCAGIQSYADMSGTANTRTHTAKAPGNSTLTVTIDSALTPDAGNHKVNSTNGITKQLMLAFSAKAESGDAKLTKLYVGNNATSSAGKASVLYLASDALGTNILSSVTGPTVNTEGLLNNINVTIPADTTSKFFILADYPTTATGQAASTSLAVNSVQWEKSDGSTASTTPTSALVSADQYMFGAVPQFSLVSSSVSSAVTSGSASATTTLTFKMNIKAHANGGSMVKPVLGDFILKIASTTATSSGYHGYHAGNSLVAGTAGGTTATLDTLSPTDSTVGDGGDYTFTLTGTIDSRVPAGTFTANPGNYRMVLTSASSSVGGNTVTQTWGLDDYQTASAFLPN